MNRKKFQKKKEREREVHKKILLKRAKSRAQDQEERKKYLLQKKADKKIPIHRMTPELQNALAIAEKIKAEESVEEVRGGTEHFVHVDDAIETKWAPTLCNRTD